MEKSNMASMDLEDLSWDELKQLEKDVAQAIRSFEARRLKEAKAAAEAAVKEFGYNLTDVLDEKPSKTQKSAPRYRHPENPAITWTGKGRQPVWYREAITAGASPEDMLIG